MVSGVGRGAGDHQREGAVLGVNMGRSIVTNRNNDTLFPNYFREDLFSRSVAIVDLEVLLLRPL